MSPAREALWAELRSVFMHCIAAGVRIFRVDNPHTKPLPFWEWVIGEVHTRHPEVILLAEAFTRPKVMKALAKAGFNQSYTYFTWRNFKHELEEYLTELTQGRPADYMIGNLWPNTPDILPEHLQQGGRPAFMLRAALAATLSSSWGIYSGYELCENRALPGKEEYADSEKYQIVNWDLERPGNIKAWISALNRARREIPALQSYRNLQFHRANNERVLFYSKATPDRSSLVLVAEAGLDGLHVVTIGVRYDGERPAERYLLPLKPDDAPLEEALDEQACLAILAILRGRRAIRTRGGALRGERFDGPDSPLSSLPERPTVRRLSAEQSNTSLVFGDAVILKLIRKLDQGKSPELEIGALLARRGFRSTPALLGALSLEGKVAATVAVAHRFVRVETDGWSYVVDAFMKDAVPPAALLGEIRELGARVGELHSALATPDEAAFAPEPIRRDDLERWTRGLVSELERTVRVAGSVVPDLQSRKDALPARIDRLATAHPSGLRLRQHGDLHLGQVLRSGGQWLIFDFEGEPARTLPERREKQSPYKDVAGMLRSFAYAAAAAEKRGAPPGDRRGPAREAFLAGYRSRAQHLLPDDETTARVLLSSLELEKLLYELRYEVGHRPDWVGIPARDLLREDA